MRRRMQLAGAVALLALLGVVAAAIAGGGGSKINERLTGYEEVPAISTDGSGKFQARVARFGDEIRYRLSYRDLEGSVQQAHIHIAQEAVNGDIVAFLCSNLPSPPPDTPACPAPSGTVSGVIGPEDVLGPGPTDTSFQGIEPGAFDEFVDAIEAGVTYANVHSSKWPGGEIRAQLDDDDKDRGHRGRD